MQYQILDKFNDTNIPESAEMFFDSIKPSSIQDWVQTNQSENNIRKIKKYNW